jgi:hypothetical protein
MLACAVSASSSSVLLVSDIGRVALPYAQATMEITRKVCCASLSDRMLPNPPSCTASARGIAVPSVRRACRVAGGPQRVVQPISSLSSTEHARLNLHFNLPTQSRRLASAVSSRMDNGHAHPRDHAWRRIPSGRPGTEAWCFDALV